MDVLELNQSGSRGLIAGIILQAIRDGILKKNPNPPNISVRNHKRHFRSIKIIRKLLNILLIEPNEINPLILFHIVKIYKFHIQERKMFNKEMIAYDGRKFIDSNNKLYCYYCDLIDLDPISFEYHTKKYFKNFDKGLIKNVKLES